jgi:cytochrome b
VGTTHARFATFFPTPARLRAYLRGEWRGPGHTPPGALSIFAMLGLVAAQAILGLFAVNDEIEFHGALYALVSSAMNTRLTGWHTQLFYVLAGFIGLHLIATGYYTFIKHNNLIAAMFNGKITVTHDVSATAVHGGGMLRFVLAAALAGTVFWAIQGGAVLRWLLPAQPAVNQKILPAW